MAANFYILLQASQFHIIYYASRPLPNMFAFGLSTFALSNLLLTKSTNSKSKRASRRLKLALYLLTITGIVFRSEVALLLLAEVLYILFRRRSTFVQTLTNDIIPAGVAGAVIGLLLTIPLDTYMWSTYPRLHWPEFSAFWFNTIEGKSSDWGTSPWYFYFTSALPRLLLNPLTWMLCIPSAIAMPGTRRTSIDVLIPSLFYVVLYSILPHKETRFVMYIIPSLTAIASAGSGYIFTRRFKSPLYYLLTLLLLLSIATSFAISTFLLALSSLNYPGGLAMQSLHHLLSNTTTILPPPGSPTPSSISIYTDNLSFQTGAIRFLEIPQPPSALTSLTATTEEGSPWNARNIKVYYDKTDEKFYPELLRSVEFWDRFDFALMERPEKAIGAWEVLDTIYAYRGIEFTKGQGQDEEKGMDAMVRDGVPFLLGDTVLLKGWRMLEGLGRRVTGGRWVRIRMEPRIRVLRRQRGAT
ncbi:MAG: dolichyl-P-Man:Man(7)GlcNAc(2)-PP-dolichol alpha-1,6-mannosyltransferase [Bogoriella megaspora]|nr:MAG: dolichyl-P-Man:Man(7)GlcNAc(2)-PP-dolichol alpha-1,6-mannosyltransferase [Bogoriella megaspora]